MVWRGLAMARWMGSVLGSRELFKIAWERYSLSAKEKMDDEVAGMQPRRVGLLQMQVQRKKSEKLRTVM